MVRRSAAIAAFATGKRLRDHAQSEGLGCDAPLRERSSPHRPQNDAEPHSQAGLLRLAAHRERGHRGGARAERRRLELPAAYSERSFLNRRCESVAPHGGRGGDGVPHAAEHMGHGLRVLRESEP